MPESKYGVLYWRDISPNKKICFTTTKHLDKKEWKNTAQYYTCQWGRLVDELPKSHWYSGSQSMTQNKN